MESGIDMAQHVISEDTFPQNEFISEDIFPQNEFISEDAFPHNEFISLEGVEFVCLINKQGRIEQSVYKNGIKLSKEKKEMFTMGIQLQNSMQRDFDDEFGPVRYSITERENSRFVSIPTLVGIVLVKLNKSVDPFGFANEIISML